MSEYNKALCDERQLNRNKEIAALQKTAVEHDERISKMEEAVLTLTTLAKNERLWKWVVIGLTAVIVTMAMGKEIAAALVMRAVG